MFSPHPIQCLLTGITKANMVERLLMVRWVIGSIFLRVDPLSYFLFQPVLHDWCNKGRGMSYPVCGMVFFCLYIKWWIKFNLDLITNKLSINTLKQWQLYNHQGINTNIVRPGQGTFRWERKPATTTSWALL